MRFAFTSGFSIKIKYGDILNVYGLFQFVMNLLELQKQKT